jgi:hypothetical protein
MSIKFHCPSCQSLLTASDDKAGAIVDCPRCRTKMLVPQVSPPTARPVPQPPVVPAVQQTANDPFSFIEPEPLQVHQPKTGSRTTTIVTVVGVVGLLSIVLGRGFLHNLPATQGRQDGPQLIPAVRNILNLSLTPEQEVVKRHVLRNAVIPDAISFEKWFPPKRANANDSNAFQMVAFQDPNVLHKIEKLKEAMQKIPVPVAPWEPQLAGMSQMDVDVRGKALLTDGRTITRSEYWRLEKEYEKNLHKYWDKLPEYEEVLEQYNMQLAPLEAKLWVRQKEMTADTVVRVVERTYAKLIGSIRTDSFYYLKNGKVVDWKSGTPASQDKLINIYYPGED